MQHVMVPHGAFSTLIEQSVLSKMVITDLQLWPRYMREHQKPRVSRRSAEK